MEYVEAPGDLRKGQQQAQQQAPGAFFSMILTLFLQMTRVKRSTPVRIPKR
jgi:hypothetical protein